MQQYIIILHNPWLDQHQFTQEKVWIVKKIAKNAGQLIKESPKKFKMEKFSPQITLKKHVNETIHIFWQKLPNILDRVYPRNTNCTQPLVARLHVFVLLSCTDLH